MSYFGFGIFFTVRRHIAIGVEHRLGAVDDLRGADQQARLYRLPVDLAEVRAGLGKHVFQIKILLACAKTRQAGSNRLDDHAVRVETKNWRIYSKHR